MKEKMRGIVRIAAAKEHYDIVMGAFGVGFGFKNPAIQVASMWREILFSEAEFQGVFSNIVFAFESSSGSTSKDGLTDIDIFREVFDPANIIQTSFR